MLDPEAVPSGQPVVPDAACAPLRLVPLQYLVQLAVQILPGYVLVLALHQVVQVQQVYALEVQVGQAAAQLVLQEPHAHAVVPR